MHIFKKTVVYAIGVGSLLLGSSAFASGLSGKINIWLWNINEPPVKSAAKSFMKKHPGTKINVVRVGHSTVRQKISPGLMSRGRGLPDISLMEDDFFDSFVGLYTSQFVNLSKMGFDKHKKDFPSYKWNSVSLKSGIYAFPFDGGPVIVFYRRSVFEKAGVDPKTINNWDDYIEAGKKIKEATGKYMLGASDDDGMYRNLMGQWGTGYFDSKGNIDMNSPKSIQSLSLLDKMNKAGILHKRSPGWDAWLRDLSSGTVVAVPAGAWLEGSIESVAPTTKGDWGVFKLPSNSGQTKGASQGGSSFVMFKKSKNKKLAYAFMEYFTTNVKNQVTAFKGGLFPTFKPVYKTEEFNKGLDFFAGQKVWKLASETVDDIINVNRTKDYSYARDEGVKAFQSVLINGKGVKESLSTAVKSLKNRTGRKVNKY